MPGWGWLVGAIALAGCATGGAHPSSNGVPLRAREAVGGTAFMASLAPLTRDEREAAIRRELMAGNIPSFLRRLRTISATAVGADGKSRTIEYEVMPDYLAIGSGDDFARMPM